ncbi:MAG: YceI family protein [Bacteroidota bacterium]
MKKLTITLMLSILCIAGIAQNQSWKVVSSAITFKIKNAGITVDGSFSGLDATINFDPTKGFGNKIEASVDVSTINTSINARDNHLKKEEYFNAEKFPKITMKATTFTKEAEGKFKGFFSITIKGTTNTVPVIFSFTETSGKTSLQGSFKINRLDYKVGDTSWIMSNDVTVNMSVDVTK